MSCVGGYLLKRKSSEQIATLEKEKIRQHELEVAEIEAAKVKAANDATVSPMSQKHDSCRKMADREARTGFPIVSAGPAFAAVFDPLQFFGHQ
jgi:hypothetical protein